MNTVARLLATVLGVGYLPFAPGTYGTAMAVPIAWATASFPLWQFVAITIAITAIGVWAADRAGRAWGTEDDQRIVIDEVAGYLVTMIPVDRHGWPQLVVGFVVFRILDQVKPWPVRWIDERLPGGWGVVFDDVGAGVQGALVMILLDHFGAFEALARL